MEKQTTENRGMDAQRIVPLMIAEQTDYLLPSVISGNRMHRQQYMDIKNADHAASAFHRKTS